MEETEKSIETENQTEKTFTEIPEGMEAVGEKLICSKHGDVTGSITELRYLKVEENENKEKVVQPYRNIFCTQCICDLLFSLQAEGKLGTIKRETQITTHENAKKLREFFAEKMKSYKAKGSEPNKAQEPQTAQVKEVDEEENNESKAE